MKAKCVCFLLLGILILSVSSYAQRDPSKRKGSAPLFPVHYGGKWGYINREGKVVIPPQFAGAGSFFDGLAWVTLVIDGQRKVGYIDESGRVVIEAKFEEPFYDEAGDFLEGLAPVRMGRKWGYIDRNGHFVIPPTFQGAGEFHEGLARVEFWDQIPLTGKPQWTKETAEDRWFRLLKDTRWYELKGAYAFPEGRFGFVDKSGRMVIEPQELSMAEDFSCGFALIRRRDGKRMKYGYMDRQGRLAFDRLFDYAEPFSEGLASVMVGDKWGFIDTNGKFVLPARYGYVSSFSEGIAEFTDPWIEGDISVYSGGIDKSGAVVIPPKFKNISEFSEGLAIANSGGKNFFIDGRGNVVHVTDLPIDWWGFRDGLAVVGEECKRVYVDKRGKVVAPFEKDSE